MIFWMLYTLAPWYVIAAWDFEEVMMIAMGFAGLAYVIADLKRERKLDQCAMDHEGRLARLEANSDDSVALEARLVHLEAAAARDERLDDRMIGYAERIATLEARVPNNMEDRLTDLVARLAVLESRPAEDGESEDADG